MTLRHIKIFLAVYEHGCNTTRAAEQLHLAQPAVSLALKELESHYGVALFERMGKRLQITSAGHQFYTFAAHIASTFDDLEKGMHAWDEGGELRIGASITIGSQFLPSYVKEFQQSHPNTEVRVLVAPSEQLEKKILLNELDIALIEGIPHDKLLIAEEYMDDHLAVICPKDGPFCQGQVLSQQEFNKQNFLLREHGSGTRKVFDRETAQSGFSVVPIWESMSTHALINAVIKGLGIAVLPYRMVAKWVEQGQVVSVSVEGMQFRRSFYILCHQKKHLTKAGRDFISLCRNYESDYPIATYSEST